MFSEYKGWKNPQNVISKTIQRTQKFVTTNNRWKKLQFYIITLVSKSKNIHKRIKIRKNLHDCFNKKEIIDEKRIRIYVAQFLLST